MREMVVVVVGGIVLVVTGGGVVFSTEGVVVRLPLDGLRVVPGGRRVTYGEVGRGLAVVVVGVVTDAVVVVIVVNKGSDERPVNREQQKI